MSSAATHTGRSATSLVYRFELRSLLRDRRAMFAAVLLPALLYPLMFWASNKMESSSKELLERREVSLALDLERLEPALAVRLRAQLDARGPIELAEVASTEAVLELHRLEEEGSWDPGLDSHRALVEEVLGEGVDALVSGRKHAELSSRAILRVYSDIKDTGAREAADRARAAFTELEQELAAARLIELVGSDPARGLELEEVDVASAEDASGLALGRMMPLLALLVLISGGAYAALAVFAGEREAGTLETLLVQPAPALAIAKGKFLAVLTVGMTTLAVNLLSILICTRVGLAALPGLDQPGASLSLWRLLSAVVYLPACVLLCATLCLFCGRARSYREGQHTIFPVMLLSAVPTLVVLKPEIEATILLSIVPFAGPALALRDALTGQLALAPTLAMLVSHALWAWLLLTRLGGLLDAERILGGADVEAESGLRRASARHGMRWAFAGVLALYVIGARMQAWNLAWGLAATLWILILGMAGLCVARRRGDARELSPSAMLQLRAPAPQHLLGVLLIVPGLARLMTEVLLPLQMRLLPLPENAMAEAATLEVLGPLSTLTLVFLFAISPGVCEELFFRGAVLSSLRRDLSWGRALLWQAGFFGLAHLSVHKLFPTALLGLLLGAITLRCRSLWPAVLLHAAYNALVVLQGLERLPEWSPRVVSMATWAALPGVLLLALPARGRAGRGWSRR